MVSRIDAGERNFGWSGSARELAIPAADHGDQQKKESFQGVITVLPDCQVRVVASASFARSEGNRCVTCSGEELLPIRRVEQPQEPGPHAEAQSPTNRQPATASE